MVLLGAPYIHDISRLRVKQRNKHSAVTCITSLFAGRKIRYLQAEEINKKEQERQRTFR
jgi:hypothetical protein